MACVHNTWMEKAWKDMVWMNVAWWEQFREAQSAGNAGCVVAA